MVFKVYAYGGSVAQNTAKNVAKASVTLNINGSYLYLGGQDTSSPGAMNVDTLHINNSVIHKLSGSEAESTENVRKGFRIMPTTSANNPGLHKLSYTVSGSYLHSPYSPIINFYGAGTDNLATRSGMKSLSQIIKWWIAALLQA